MGNFEASPLGVIPTKLTTKYTNAVDVYSFGLVIWEVLVGRAVFEGMTVGGIVQTIMEGERPPIPEDIPITLRGLMRACWDTNPESRPHMNEVVEALEGALGATPAK